MNTGKSIRWFALGAALWLGQAQAATSSQLSYATPDEAVAALVAAARAHDQATLLAIFGPNSEKLVSSGDRYADQERQTRFVTAYDAKHALVPTGDGRMQLDVGPNDWPMPIPIAQTGGRWHFDTATGSEEIINRRIGRDELSAIQVALTYVNAQKDYFERQKQQTGTGAYAQRMISTRGHQDGLYWPAAAGTADSPFAALVAQAEAEGYPAPGAENGGRRIPYQGYYFRILKSQGPDAPGGALNYISAGRMIGGFALIAWPAIYGSSGIMTFQVNQDGVVFQKDLGEGTAETAARITEFDPDLSWARVEVTNQ